MAPDDEASEEDVPRSARRSPEELPPPTEDELEAAPRLLLCRTGGALDEGRTRTGPCSYKLAVNG